jgi:hypothetical protein
MRELKASDRPQALFDADFRSRCHYLAMQFVAITGLEFGLTSCRSAASGTRDRQNQPERPLRSSAAAAC